MTRISGLVARLFLLVSLVLASLPAGAVQTVCVIGRGVVVVPIATCKMPCCAHRLASSVPVPKRACCRDKEQVVSQGDPCRYAGMSCHCETRLVLGTTPTVQAKPDAFLIFADQTAVIVPPTWSVDRPILDLIEPGIVGVDSGPSRKSVYVPDLGRAPPVSYR